MQNNVILVAVKTMINGHVHIVHASFAMKKDTYLRNAFDCKTVKYVINQVIMLEIAEPI